MTEWSVRFQFGIIHNTLNTHTILHLGCGNTKHIVVKLKTFCPSPGHLKAQVKGQRAGSRKEKIIIFL